MLIEDLKADKDATDVAGLTPLILACAKGSLEVAKLLIDLGCNIESETNFGGTALKWAACNGHESCVRILLAAKAQVDVKDNSGGSPLDYAIENFQNEGNDKSLRIVKLLKGQFVIPRNELEEERKKRKLEEIMEAAIEGSLARFFDVQEVPHVLVPEVLTKPATVASLENLLQTLWFGGDLEHKEKPISRTALHCAARYGTIDTVKVLLDHGSLINVRDRFGSSPLARAVRHNKFENMKLILQAKAQVNVKDLAGWTPLLFAARYGTGKMVAELVKFGADLDYERDGTGVYEMATYNDTYSKDVLTTLESFGIKQS